MTRTFQILAAIGLTLTTATALHAQNLPNPGSPSLPDDADLIFNWPDFHQNNRAIAFGAILMENGGNDVNGWKEIRAINWCDVIIGKPGDDIGRPIGRTLAERLAGAQDGDDQDGGDSDDDDDAGAPIGLACWDVLATTTYELVECPDGRAYIQRSGEGVQLVDRNSGEMFSWSEGILCGDDGLGSDGMNAKRKLDYSKIRKIAK